MPVNKKIKFHQIERTEETLITPPPKKAKPTRVLIALGFLIFLAPLALIINARAKPKENNPGLIISTRIERDIKAKLEKDIAKELKEDISKKLGENISKKLEKDISVKLKREILARLEKDISAKLGKNLSEKLSKDISQQLEKKISSILKKQYKEKISSKKKKNTARGFTKKTKKNPKNSLVEFKKAMATISSTNKRFKPIKQITKIQPKKSSSTKKARKKSHGKVSSFSFYFTSLPRWTKNSYYKDSHYHGSIEATCRVSALNGGGLKKLKAHLENWTNERALENHPSHPNKWLARKNIFKYKVNVISRPCANYDKDSTGMINMNFMCYLGYKKEERVIFLTKCEKIIFAKGKKERLKAFQSFSIYTKDKRPGYYNVYVRRYFKIKGYWYEPSGMFVREVRKETLESFGKDIEKRARKWASNL